MKKTLLSVIFAATAIISKAQPITITASDMPVSGDSLRYSYVSPVGSTIDISTTGANSTWNFSTLVPVSQGLDSYKPALLVNAAYGLISLNAYGYKVADSLPGASTLPISVSDLYTFFSKKNNPSRFVAEAFAAKIAGTPIPIVYSDEDEWYEFPLDYNDVDNSTFKLSYSFVGLGAFSQQGTRNTTVDGWGTITTPHFTTPVNCLRIRSVVDEIDTFKFQTTVMPIVRTTVDYKWLANGEHYPILWITTTVTAGNETVSAVRFRDHYRQSLGVTNVARSIQELKAYPNPAYDITTLAIPQDWKHYTVELFDAQGKLVMQSQNTPEINTAGISTGLYIVRVTSADNIGYVRLVK
jgi:hypothetical protein